MGSHCKVNNPRVIWSQLSAPIRQSDCCILYRLKSVDWSLVYLFKRIPWHYRSGYVIEAHIMVWVSLEPIAFRKDLTCTPRFLTFTLTLTDDRLGMDLILICKWSRRTKKKHLSWCCWECIAFQLDKHIMRPDNGGKVGAHKYDKQQMKWSQ